MAEAGSCIGQVSSETLARDKDKYWMGRVEIDTSAPFESVKEAVTRFEGGAIPRKTPQLSQQISKMSDVEISAIKEESANLEKELIVKERETLDVLKELEATKVVVDELRTKIKVEDSEISEKNIEESGCSKPSPSLILMELKQAKVNLTRATGGLVDIRASIESLSKEIENERAVIDETRERISSNSSRILELEKELHQTRLLIQFARNDSENGGCTYPPDISLELHKLNSEVEQYRRMAEAGEQEVCRMRAEIERMKTSINTAEKMEEKSRAAEARTHAEIKESGEYETQNNKDQDEEEISGDRKRSASIAVAEASRPEKTEEYETLGKENDEEEYLSAGRMRSAMAAVEEANRSKEEMHQRVEEATIELETSRKALTEALALAESTNQGKLLAEEALRRWRSEHNMQRRRRMVADGSKTLLRPTLSIGQILSQKLYGSSDFEAAELNRSSSLPSQPKMSLGEMLSRRQAPPPSPPISDHHRSVRKRTITSKMKKKKRKNFGFAGISQLLANQGKNQTSAKKKRKKKTHVL